MCVRFQTKRYIACKHINLHGLLPLRGANFRWADLVSGNLKEVGTTSVATVALWDPIVNPHKPQTDSRGEHRRRFDGAKASAKKGDGAAASQQKAKRQSAPSNPLFGIREPCLPSTRASPIRRTPIFGNGSAKSRKKSEPTGSRS
jgi:hypothetical protein